MIFGEEDITECECCGDVKKCNIITTEIQTYFNQEQNIAVCNSCLTDRELRIKEGQQSEE